MKWFKHDTNALHDAKVEKLIMKYGVEGYGLYFACVEMIASDITPKNLTFELEHDAEIIAYKFRIDTLKVEKIMLYCIELGLFGQSEITGRVTCFKLALRLDESSSKNPQIKAMQETIKNDSENFGKNQKPSNQIRLDENRVAKNRTEESKPKRKNFIPPTKEQLMLYCNEIQYNLDHDKFLDYHLVRGWELSKGRKIKDWKAVVRTWQKNENKWQNDKPGNKSIEEIHEANVKLFGGETV